jgi:hypothetical protein
VEAQKGRWWRSEQNYLRALVVEGFDYAQQNVLLDWLYNRYKFFEDMQLILEDTRKT